MKGGNRLVPVVLLLALEFAIAAQVCCGLRSYAPTGVEMSERAGEYAGPYAGEVSGCPAQFTLKRSEAGAYVVAAPEGGMTGVLWLTGIEHGTNLTFIWEDDDGTGVMRLHFDSEFSRFAGTFGHGDDGEDGGGVWGVRTTASARHTVTQAALSAALVMVKGRFGSGSAFFAKRHNEERIWLYSNLHVLLGQLDVQLTGQDGTRYTPRIVTNTHGATSAVIEAAVDRDLVRMLVNETPRMYLTIATPPDMGWAVTYGYPQGEAVLRTLDGRILGIGPATIEVDCPFVEGNSGGPIVHDGQVVGVATYLIRPNADWVNSNTPFTVARRFGVRLDNSQSWTAFSSREFAYEGVMLRTRLMDMLTLAHALTHLAASPYLRRLPAQTYYSQPLSAWVTDYNAWVKRNNARIVSQVHADGTPSFFPVYQTMRSEGAQKFAELKRAIKSTVVRPALPTTREISMLRQGWDDLRMLGELICRYADIVANVSASDAAPRSPR